MNRPLMPKATALWLMRHTRLTHAQIGLFCDLHPLEVEVLMTHPSFQESNPLMTGQLTQQEIDRCQENPEHVLQLNTPDELWKKTRKIYTPLSKRPEIPGAILWLVKNHPQLTEAKICALLPTTKTMVKSIREGTYRHFKGLIAKDPVVLGLCTAQEVHKMLEAPADTIVASKK